MKTKYKYLVTAVKIYPVTEFIEFPCEAYTNEQAVYFLKQRYGYKGLRDIRPIRGTAVKDENQLELNIG